MLKTHKFHLSNHNLDIEVIEFEHQNLYLNIEYFEKLFKTSFDAWYDKDKQQLAELKADLYLDQRPNYSSAKEFKDDFIKDFNGQRLGCEIIMCHYIVEHNRALYSDVVTKCLNVIWNQHNQ